MDIYFDNCCYGRYLDDLSKGNNKQELEAIKYIVDLSRIGVFQLWTSDVSYYEARKIGTDIKRELMISLLDRSLNRIKGNEEIIRRAKVFKNEGIKMFDALHLASAEKECNLFFTVDRTFGNKAQRIKDLNISVYNPLSWINKEE